MTGMLVSGTSDSSEIEPAAATPESDRPIEARVVRASDAPLGMALPAGQLTYEEHLARYKRGLNSDFMLHAIFLAMAIVVITLSFMMRSQGNEMVFLPGQTSPMPPS